jgi:hypothetical protein
MQVIVSANAVKKYKVSKEGSVDKYVVTISYFVIKYLKTFRLIPKIKKTT